MTATDDLRRLLDERGIEYKVRVEDTTGIKHIIWHTDEFSLWDWNEEFGVGWLDGWQHNVTPEQAIAATLGNDGVERTNDGVAERECDQLKDENAKLREQLDDAEHNRTRNAREYARMCHENDKLRELVRAAWECIRMGVSCSDCRLTFGGCTLQTAMRELGVDA